MEETKSQYLFGMHPVIEAIRSGRRIDKLLLKQGLEGAQYRELMTLAADKDIPYQWVPVEKLHHISKGGSHQGVVALMGQIDYVELDTLVENALKKPSGALVFILDGVSDVRNLGAIARTLEVAGGSGIIVPAKGGAAMNAEAVKASAGALLRIDCCKVSNLKIAVYTLKEAGFQIVAASEKAQKTIYDVDFTKPTAIIMGSEGSGISKSMLTLSDEISGIPQLGEIGSLNVSVASAVVAFEAVRQRMNANK